MPIRNGTVSTKNQGPETCVPGPVFCSVGVEAQALQSWVPLPGMVALTEEPLLTSSYSPDL